MWLSSISQFHWVMWLSSAWCDLSPALVYLILLKLGHLLTIWLITTYPNPAVKTTLLQELHQHRWGPHGGEAGGLFAISVPNRAERKIPVEASFLSPTGKWGEKNEWFVWNDHYYTPEIYEFAPLKGSVPKGKYSLNHHFSGALLIFGGVILSRSYLLRFWFFVGGVGVFWKHLLVKACWVDHRSRGQKQGGPSTSYKWSYSPHKWPYKWVTGVIIPQSGVMYL